MGEVVILPTVRIEREAQREAGNGAREAVRRYFADAGWDEPMHSAGLMRVDDFLIWLWMEGFVIRKAEEFEEG